MEYGRKIFACTDIRALIGIGMTASLLLYAVRNRKRAGVYAFAVLWFFVALLPVSNIYPINAYMAEHWLYLPSVGFFLALANAVASLYHKNGVFRRGGLLAIGAITALYAALGIRQNSVYWTDPIRFYERTIRYAPDSFIIYNNLANIYLRTGKNTEAITLYKRSLNLAPRNAPTYSNLGLAYKNIGDIPNAIASYTKAIELNPSHPNGYNNLGNIYKEIGKSREALLLYQKAAELAPDDAGIYYNLASAYKNIGDEAAAAAAHKRANEISPYRARQNGQ
jgi:tetratricopeptide (TPR) repeat protein